MGMKVEQSCPQCGGHIELDEVDRLIECPYCDVRSFLFSSHYFRFLLPPRVDDQEIIFAPYLRFKGVVYFCYGLDVDYRVVDITNLGISLDPLPMSLGFRPQAVKMRFVAPGAKGRFLRFSLKASDIVMKACNLARAQSSDSLFHRAFIGESLSLVYLPLYIRGGRLFDGLSDKPICTADECRHILESQSRKGLQWGLEFMPAVCPKCGWNLGGAPDSVVLICGNCESAWEASEGRFVPLRTLVMNSHGTETVYLPFWWISADAPEIGIHSFADFIRVTNQPRVASQEWESRDLSFWIPAFKIRPGLFLNLARRFTLAQASVPTSEGSPGRRSYPVTLPKSEARQSMKTVLADATMDKKHLLPLLPKIKFRLKDSALVYVPFVETGQEMIQEDMHVSINRNALEFGRSL